MKIPLNKKNKLTFLLFVLCLINCLSVVSANLELPAVIGSNMVLQREYACNLWGWAKAGDTIAITVGWSKKTQICITDSVGPCGNRK